MSGKIFIKTKSIFNRTKLYVYNNRRKKMHKHIKSDIKYSNFNDR